MAATYEELMAKSREFASSGDMDNARRVAQIALKRRDAAPAQPAAAPPETNMVEQSMSGVNEGIANMAGLPVDAVTGAINMGMQGINKVAGTDLQPIENPIGGSESLRGLLSPTISDTAPQTAAQRYGRRIGQEVGASVVPGGVAMRSAQAPAKVAAGTGASAVGAGTAGQTSREIAPENDTMDMIASLIGGAAIPGGMYASQSKPQAPSMDDLQARQTEAYGAVEQSDSRLTDESTKQLVDAIKDRSARDAMDPILSPKAARTAEKISEMQNPTIGEVEKMRRLTGRVAGNLDPSESSLGMGMKEEITDYLDNLSAENVTGSDPTGAVSSLREGRDVTRRIKASETVAEAMQKGERRAATGGTGGNEVNAIRQNIRAILDSKKKSAGFTPEELETMEGIARGTVGTNSLRHIGRLSPTTGALPGMAGGGMFATAATLNNPLFAIPPTAGYLAKAGAEALTNKQISQLQDLIRNGAPLDTKTMSDAQKRVVAAMLSSQATDAGAQ